MLTKPVLRADAVARRRAMSTGQRDEAGQAFAAALAGLLHDATQVAAYASVATEPPTAPLLALRGDALLPVLLPEGDLTWAVGQPRRTPRGLLEPTGPRLGVDAISTCDIVLVPALAVDRAGNRLGRGGGSYDRALHRATGLTIALLYDGELVEAVPAEAHDVPVAAALMPSSGLVRF